MWPDPQFPADFVILTEEILNGRLLERKRKKNIRNAQCNS